MKLRDSCSRLPRYTSQLLKSFVLKGLHLHFIRTSLRKPSPWTMCDKGKLYPHFLKVRKWRKQFAGKSPIDTFLPILRTMKVRVSESQSTERNYDVDLFHIELWGIANGRHALPDFKLNATISKK
jgi:hypothetical protein